MGVPASPKPRIWLAFNLLSLDAPLIAVLWQNLFARAVHVRLGLASVIALFLTVWVIYLCDRLLDSRSADTVLPTARHFYHRNHFRALTMLVLMLLPVLLVACLTLRLPVLISGIELAALVVAYFTVVHAFRRTTRPVLPKEVAVGVLFAAGTCLVPWVRLHHSLELTLAACLFGVMCSMNCAAIEVWEQPGYARQGACPHWLTLWLVRHFRLVLMATGFIAAVGAFVTPLPSLYGAMACAAALFLALHAGQRRMQADTLRVLADVPLLTPLLFLGVH